MLETCSTIRHMVLLCTIVPETEHESAWIVSCRDSGSGLSFFLCSFLKAWLYCKEPQFSDPTPKSTTSTTKTPVVGRYFTMIHDMTGVLLQSSLKMFSACEQMIRMNLHGSK